MQSVMSQCDDAGTGVLPFGKLVYVMPPYIISARKLELRCNSLIDTVAR